jgi:hypothetical protein
MPLNFYLKDNKEIKNDLNEESNAKKIFFQIKKYKEQE